MNVAGRRIALASLLRHGALALVAVCGNSVAQGSGALEVLNQGSREVRRFELGDTPFTVDVRFVPGWRKCDGRPLKRFDLQGRSTVRAELYCYTDSGAAVGFSCVASRGDVLEASIGQLLATGSRFTSPDNIDTRGAAELRLICYAP